MDNIILLSYGSDSIKHSARVNVNEIILYTDIVVADDIQKPGINTLIRSFLHTYRCHARTN